MLQKIVFLWLILFALSQSVKSNDQVLSSIETNKLILLKKDRWLHSLLHSTTTPQRQKRQISHESISFFKRSCPLKCSCNYDSISCNELIDACPECFHWSSIDFNHINVMKPYTFKNFRFAPDRRTHVIIYKLIDSTLTADIFKDLVIPQNSQIEITFQYNSVIKFDPYVLRGVLLKSNSSLIFNFPYTTQVLFVSKCFDGMIMQDSQSKLIIRVLKSFSVRFVNDFINQGLFEYKQKLQQSSGYPNNNNKTSSLSLSVPNPEININKQNSSWSLDCGQLIIDIKSTHLVKFEDFSLAFMQLKTAAKFYVDLDLIEKLIIQRKSLANLDLEPSTKVTIYGRHLTFIDFRAYSFADIYLAEQARMQIYLEELLHSLCLQRNVFDGLALNKNSHFNFSVINSKNTMLMHDSFSNLVLNSPASRLFIGVYNKPSFLLSLKTNNYYQEFLKERVQYKWTTNFGNGEQVNYDQYTGMFQPPFPVSSDYLYGNVEDQLEGGELNLKGFFQNHKQDQYYAYNLSIEHNCFSKLKLNFDQEANNIWIVADYINTLLLDTKVVTNDQTYKFFRNLNFLLNVQHFIPSTNAFADLNHVRIEFLKPPRVFRLGLESENNLNHNDLSQFNVKIVGLDLNKNSNIYEQDNVDIDTHRPDTSIEEACQISRLPTTHTLITFSARYPTELNEACSCETIYLVMNQITKSLNVNTLNCLLDEDTILMCTQSLKNICDRRLVFNLGSRPLNETYIRFWEFCISETDQNKNIQNQGNYYLNNMNDPDGNMFSASLSSSSLFESSDSFKSSLSQPGESIPELFDQSRIGGNNYVSSNFTNVGKIVGFIILAFLIGIILFMIVVNIIQYKFRNELLDDLEYTSQNGGHSVAYSNRVDNREFSNVNGGGGCERTQNNFWKKTFSANSLRRTLSVASLRSKRNIQNKSCNYRMEDRDASISSSDNEDEDVKFEPRRDTSEEDEYDEGVYAKNAPILRNEHEVDSFYDSNQDSDDEYSHNVNRKDSGLVAGSNHEMNKKKAFNLARNKINHNDSGNLSEMITYSNSNSGILPTSLPSQVYPV